MMFEESALATSYPEGFYQGDIKPSLEHLFVATIKGYATHERETLERVKEEDGPGSEPVQLHAA